MRSERRSKIYGLFIFAVLIFGMLYLSIISERKEFNRQIKSIKITGNYLLNQNEYLAFAKLDNDSQINVTLPVIKSRLEKHPYVKRADVEFSGDNEVHINISEKHIKAVLVNGNKFYLATGNFEILPLFPNTKISDMPVITNISNSVLLKKNQVLKTPDLVEAFKIIDTTDLTNEELYKKLSEINLRNGGDIILLFSGINPPVIFGRGNTVNKIYSFNQLLKEESLQSRFVMNSSYIDLRFNNEIFLGNYDKTDLTE